MKSNLWGHFYGYLCLTFNMQETSFLQKCRKFSYKLLSWYKFETTVSILNMCRKFSYKMQENFLHMSASAGKFPTDKCKMLHKCRKISCTYSKNLDFLVKCRKHVSYTFNFQIRVHLATDFHFLFLLEHVFIIRLP